jgi:hypothetical protein
MRGRTLAVALLGVPGAALAAPGEAELGFSLRYDPSPECPPRADFEQAIVSRAGGAAVVSPGSATMTFDVELSSSASGTAAVLVTGLPDGTRSRRDVTAETCAEAVSALAVIAALSLNGYREAKSGSPPDTIGTGAPSARPAEPPAPPTEPAPASPARDTGAPLASSEQPVSAFRPGAFLGAVWESAVAPSAPLGASLGVEVEMPRSGVFWPTLRGSVLATLTGSVDRDEGSATFRLFAARLGFCPLGWGNAAGPSLHACVELDAGKYSASGSGDAIEGPLEQSMPWLAGGAAGRGEWPLVSWLSVEASAAVRGLARHDRFVFRPETVVYDVPPVSVGVGLGVVGRMP